MALKIHIIARQWTPAGSVQPRIATLCGAEAYKHHSGTDGPNEWQSARYIGGLRAVPERAFMPSRDDDCAKCRKKWMAGADA